MRTVYHEQIAQSICRQDSRLNCAHVCLKVANVATRRLGRRQASQILFVAAVRQVAKFLSIAQEVIQLQEARTALLQFRILAFLHRLIILRIEATKLNERVKLFATLRVRDESRHAERGESALQEASIVRCASATHRQVAPESLRVHTATVALRRCRCLMHGSTRQRRQINA